MMMDKNGWAIVREAKDAYNRAIENRTNIEGMKTYYQNVLFNYAGAMLSMEKEYDDLMEEFNAEVSESARLRKENMDLKAELAKLKEPDVSDGDAPPKKKKNG